MIKKYAPTDDYSVFMCGPKAMYDFEERDEEAWVHPCCTFPLGDIELEVFPIS